MVSDLLVLVETEFYTDHHISKLRILYYRVYKTNYCYLEEIKATGR